MKIEIESVDNGYIVKTEGQKIVIELDDNKEKDCKATRSLLYTVLDMLGEAGSKHDAERVRIIIVNSEEKEVEDK
ncbi:MAG: hypothetical protein WC208_08485 [Gallionella sp.]|jgi:hypothetical protein